MGNERGKFSCFPKLKCLIKVFRFHYILIRVSCSNHESIYARTDSRNLPVSALLDPLYLATLNDLDETLFFKTAELELIAMHR